ncbi:MAG: arsenate reductase ArsC [Phycisphaerae bacterium]|nr:arsenate reductase ArsC [Phycisphaerae bacterium]
MDGISLAKKQVLILCTGNSCRSQMAEAFWRRHGGDRWNVVSAGTRPSGAVHPLAVRAMAEAGIDIHGCRSKSLEPYLDRHFDLVITVCSDADANCPHFPNARKRLHHGFDDPPKAPGDEEAQMQVARRVRDEIEAQVKAWIATESPPHT